MTELLDCKPLLEFMATDKKASDFGQKPQTVRSQSTKKIRLLTLSAKRFTDKKITFTVVTASAAERQMQRQKAAHRKINELTGTLNLSDQLLLQVNEDGTIGWANEQARLLLDERLANTKTSQRLTDVLQASGVPGFEEAREQATSSASGESGALTLRPRQTNEEQSQTRAAANSRLALRGHLRKLPNSTSNKMVLAASDIGAEQLLQESLQRQEALHHQLMQSSPVALIILDGQTSKVIEVNSTVHEQLGYTTGRASWQALVGMWFV